MKLFFPTELNSGRDQYGVIVQYQAYVFNQFILKYKDRSYI